jgi:hypothetical protein
MPDPFTVTLISIVLVTMIAAFIKGRTRDKCLKDFSKNRINLELTSGKTVFGTLRVEATGLELEYDSPHRDEQGHSETSYLLYKNEYPTIQALIRFHNELSEKNKKKRARQLKGTYHPGFFRRLKRKIANIFRTLKDSVMEVVNLFMGQMKRGGRVGAVLTTQDKYVSKLKQDLMGSVTASFEPLLEKHIGKTVVLEMIRGDQAIELSCVLRDYTADFIEVMDADYGAGPDTPSVKADLVVPRTRGIIRHLGE